uniref:RNase H type-1 domain-containing protein n=1 Tax=Populus trichocarpa TaxID=3694 RepID=A0A2K1XD98_POPTR
MPEQVRQVKQLIRGYSLAFSLPSGSVSSRAAELVSWKVPDVDWWKLNVDGSVLATSGAAVSSLLSCQKLVESDSMEAIIQLLTTDTADHHPQDALIKDTRVCFD